MTTKMRREVEASSIAEQAVEWLATLVENPSVEVRTAFSTWVSQSPRNVEAFLRASALNATLSEMGDRRALGELPNPLPDLTELAVDLPHRRAKAMRRHGVTIGKWAVAATIAAVAVAVGSLWVSRTMTADWQRYASAIGEQRTVLLEDGSTMFLSPASEVELRLDSDERTVRLESGEAMFKVAHDPARPFRVHSGAVVVQAIGTQFNVVRYFRGDTVVAVVEGAVQVSKDNGLIGALSSLAAPSSTVRISAGQETRIAKDGVVATPTASVVDRTEAWRDRRLTFVNETLTTIAEEFNRYNRTQIKIEDATAGAFRYAAAIDADDPQSLLDVLGQDSQLAIEYRGQEIVIRSRSAAR